MKYKGYIAHISYDDERKTFKGEVLGLVIPMFFSALSVRDLEISFKDAIEVYLGDCKAKGVKPEKVFSGKFNVRISPALHAKLTAKAKIANMSLNEYIIVQLERTSHDKI